MRSRIRYLNPLVQVSLGDDVKNFEDFHRIFRFDDSVYEEFEKSIQKYKEDFPEDKELVRGIGLFTYDPILIEESSKKHLKKASSSLPYLEPINPEADEWPSMINTN